MVISKLTSSNIKCLKTIEITPEGSIVIISGKNHQGKSSAMDSIWLGLKGLAGEKIDPCDIIREGEKEAKVELDLGKYIVTRTFTKKDDYLKVVIKDGGKGSQSLLNELMGDLAKEGLLFDPLAFINLEPKKQLALFMKAIGIDYEKIEKERKQIFDERTDVNRILRDLNGQLQEFQGKSFTNVPDQEVSSSGLIQSISAAQKTIQEYDKKREDLKGFYNKLIAKHDLKEKMEAELKALNDELENGKQYYHEMKDAVKGLMDPDIAELQLQLQNIEATNRVIREKQKATDLQLKHSDAFHQANQLTEKLKEIDEKKIDAIKAAKIPIEGLSFNEDGLTLNLIPFNSSLISSSEALKVGIAVAMAFKPQLKVLRIQNGNQLDSESLAHLEGTLKENGWQAWIEFVDETNEKGIVIENGEIKKINSNQAAA